MVGIPTAEIQHADCSAVCSVLVYVCIYSQRQSLCASARPAEARATLPTRSCSNFSLHCPVSMAHGHSRLTGQACRLQGMTLHASPMVYIIQTSHFSPCYHHASHGATYMVPDSHHAHQLMPMRDPHHQHIDIAPRAHSMVHSLHLQSFSTLIEPLLEIVEQSGSGLFRHLVVLLHIDQPLREVDCLVAVHVQRFEHCLRKLF